MGPTETRDSRTEGSGTLAEVRGPVSLEYLARSLADLDHESRTVVLRTADRYANASGRSRIDGDRWEQASEKVKLPIADVQGPRLRETFSLENVEEAFTYKAWDPWQQDQGNQVRDALVHAAKTILRTVPPTPLRTRALNMLFDARMIANAAVTHSGRF